MDVEGEFYRFKDKLELIRWAESLAGDEFPLRLKYSTEKDVRTLTQNKAMHKYFSLLADECNARGKDMRVIIKEGVSIDWTGDLVKKYLWKPVQEAVLGHARTSKLKTSEVSLVYEALSQALAEKHGVITDFPSRFG